MSETERDKAYRVPRPPRRSPADTPITERLSSIVVSGEVPSDEEVEALLRAQTKRVA